MPNPNQPPQPAEWFNDYYNSPYGAVNTLFNPLASLAVPLYTAAAQMNGLYNPAPPPTPPPLPNGQAFAPTGVYSSGAYTDPSPLGLRSIAEQNASQIPQWGGASQVPQGGIANALTQAAGGNASNQVAGTPARTHGGPAALFAPFGGIGVNNPNEPAPMANQYNAKTINAAKPPTGTGGNAGGAAGGTGARKPETTFQQPLFDSNGQRADMYMDAQGNRRSMNKYVDVSYLWLDKNLGRGFTDAFIDRMKVDPIRFYMKAFQDDPFAGGYKFTGEPNEWLIGKAAHAAENDAKFQPGAVARWQELHGNNTPIPQDQWEKWWYMAQNGNYYDQDGRPYGVA